MCVFYVCVETIYISALSYLFHGHQNLYFDFQLLILLANVVVCCNGTHTLVAPVSHFYSFSYGHDLIFRMCIEWALRYTSLHSVVILLRPLCIIGIEFILIIIIRYRLIKLI